MSTTDLVPDPKDASLSQIRKFGLLPAIKSRKDYARAVEHGSIDARLAYDSARCLTEPSIDKILKIHSLIFGKIHPQAGNFRELGVGVRFGTYEGAESSRIEAELELLFKQTTWILRQQAIDPISEMDLAGYVAIAHFHCKFERIHPFRDGNGRTGRSVLYSQMRELGASDIVISDRADYIERIKAANEGELAPLVKLLLGADSDFTFEMRSPFRMEPIGWEHPQASLNKDEAFRNSFL